MDPELPQGISGTLKRDEYLAVSHLQPGVEVMNG